MEYRQSAHSVIDRFMKIVCLFSGLAVIVCTGCNREKERNLEILEKAVYEHYGHKAEDSLKLVAAKFLIENMPGHFSVRDEDYLGQVASIAQTKGISYPDKKALEMFASYYGEGAERLSDADAVSPDFLIRHIDRAFEQRAKFPWLRDIDDETFFEYLLSYRFLNEPLDYWRDSLTIAPQAFSDMISCDNLKYDPAAVASHVYTDRESGDMGGYAYVRHLPGVTADKGCYFFAAANLLRYRASGIPSAIDFIPAYANRNGGHCWVSVISSDGRFGKSEIDPGRRAPKIYRYMYSRTNRYADYRMREYLSEMLGNPFIKDVTDCYLNTRDVTVPVSGMSGGKLPNLCFLAVFNAGQWIPVAVAERKMKRATFDRMAVGNVYLPVYYWRRELKAFNYPFIVNERDGMVYLIPDHSRTRKIRISRKYPYNEKLNGYCKSLEGMEIWGSDERSFDRARRLCVLKKGSGDVIFDNSVSLSGKFRYLKLLSRKPVADLSEIVVYDEKGHAVGCVPTDSCFKKSTDRDPLTYVRYVRDNKKEMVIDLKSLVGITRIVCVPRNDGNSVFPGSVYELFYYGMDGWESLGIKRAEDYNVEYEDVPAGALYWLKCLTGGVEERIFTFTDKDGIRFF
ncbi:MAG TPA: hypothetical protein DDY73_09100 [Coprobacter fastidiosus]|uniref:F5/8 type C domain-containing protein n=1 Tax=Coprobacter fastidiosus TaxID=1099853 RepID=A0A354M3Q9_9BACT|nr:hypothetical protein [Coprobacter fastidiosus]